MNPRNGIRQALENGGTVVGARCMTRSPVIVEVYADLGFDFVWIDFEHGGGSPWNAPMFERLVRTAAASEVDLLVRLPNGDPHLIQKVLDTGVRTVLIPRVTGADDVRRAVRASRFRYDGGPGDRGAASGLASRWGTVEDYVEREDDTTLVGVMIETEEAVEEIDELLAVPELGFAFVGPADLSIAYGHPLRTDHPDVATAIQRVLDACREAGVPVGRVVADVGEATGAAAEGARILRVGSEAASTREVLGERLSAIREGL